MPEHRYYYLETEKRIDHINIRCEFLPSVCCFATTNAHTNEFNFDTFCCPIFSIFDVLIVVRFTSSVKARHTQTDTHRVRHATRWVCCVTPMTLASHFVWYHRSWSLFYDNSFHYHFCDHFMFATQFYLSTKTTQSTERASTEQCETIFKWCLPNKSFVALNEIWFYLLAFAFAPSSFPNIWKFTAFFRMGFFLAFLSQHHFIVVSESNSPSAMHLQTQRRK